MPRAYGEVVVVDRFGNAMPGVSVDLLDPVTNVRIPDTVFAVVDPTIGGPLATVTELQVVNLTSDLSTLSANVAANAAAILSTNAAVSLLAPLASPTFTGPITMAAAVSQIVPGATSFAIRNHANTADNLLVTDAGAVTVRAGLTVAAGNVGIGASPLPQIGLSLLPTINAVGTQGFGAYIGPTLVATANGDSLIGLYPLPTFSVNGKTGVTAAVIDIPSINVAGAQNVYSLRIGAPSGGSGENLGIKNLGATRLDGPIGIGMAPNVNTAFTVAAGMMPSFNAGSKYVLWDPASGVFRISLTGPTS